LAFVLVLSAAVLVLVLEARESQSGFTLRSKRDGLEPEVQRRVFLCVAALFEHEHRFAEHRCAEHEHDPGVARVPGSPIKV
jgi:hypothetical protein